MTRKIGLGGGCHWCTEAVFQSLKGVIKVDQGYIFSNNKNSYFSEAVLVTYRPEEISLKTLIEIHLLTHESTPNHSFRNKYRSAVYFLDPDDETLVINILKDLQREVDHPLTTKVLRCGEFKASRGALQHYYFSDPRKPFCRRHVEPKIQLLLKRFRRSVALQKFGLKE